MKAAFLLFFLVPLAGISYVAWRSYHVVPLPTWGKWSVAAVMAALFVSLFLAMGPRLDKLPMGVATVVYEVCTSWLIVLLYLFLAFLVIDVLRLCRVVPSSVLHDNAVTTWTLVAALSALLIYGNIHYRHKQRHTVELTTAKALTRPLKIVMLSDLHLGYHNRGAELHRWVELLNQEHADLILVAGDIVDRSIRPLLDDGMDREMLRLNAPVVACLGNHEYYVGRDGSQDFYRRADITLLRDSIMEWGPLQIIGRDDGTNRARKSLDELCRNIDKERFTILLDHQPHRLEEAEQAGIDFQFSGHTHHGQVWPISWITDGVYECAYGPWQRGGTRYYVSSGMGIWGGKFRIGTCSEYVVVTISPESAAQ